MNLVVAGADQNSSVCHFGSENAHGITLRLEFVVVLRTLPDMVAVQTPVLWHEGLPASAPAISLMLASLAWKHAGHQARRWLTVYAAAGCGLSVVSGVNWPVEIAAGALVGWVGAKIGEWYFAFTRRVIARTL